MVPAPKVPAAHAAVGVQERQSDTKWLQAQCRARESQCQQPHQVMQDQVSSFSELDWQIFKVACVEKAKVAISQLQGGQIRSRDHSKTTWSRNHSVFS